MLRKIYNFLDWLIKIGAYIAGIFILLMAFMTFYEVIARGFFNSPTSWALELSIYSLIGSCFLGSAYGVRTYSHITVDLLVNTLSERGRIIINYIVNVLGLLFSVIFTIYGFKQVIKTYELGTTSTSLLRIPMYLPELMLPVGGILLMIAFILQIVDGKAHPGGDQA